MENQKIFQQLKEHFGDRVLGYEENFGDLTIFAEKENNLKILQYLYNELNFNFLVDITAIHYPNNTEKELVVTYLVRNLYEKVQVRLKFFLDVKNPSIFTASRLFLSANWIERECYDFFGVQFIGHPNLTRIMNTPEMDYFPLRKEYTLEDPTRKDKDDNMFGRGGDLHFENS